MSVDSTSAPASTPPPAPSTPDRSPRRGLLVSLAITGIIIRVTVALTPPTPPMLWDHHEYVVWSQQMVQSGTLHLYDSLPPVGQVLNPLTSKVVVPRKFEQQSANYPPLAAYLLRIQGAVLHALDPDMVSNTKVARLTFSLAAIIGDLIIAAGCCVIAARLGGSAGVQAMAFGAVALGPPFIIDCAHWGQTDSWVLAPLVWMVVMMMRRRWIGAGLLWGVALGLKTQAVLAAPIWLVVLLVVRRQRRTVVAGGMLAGLVLLAAAVPFMLTSGWAWFERAFLFNLVHAYPTTTLYAFNVWYLDLLHCENDDAMQRFAGLTKDTWGKLMLAVAVLAAIIWSVRRRWRGGRTIVPFTALLLLAAVMLPTRVHERYILLPLPFLIAATGWHKRLWWALLPLMIAATTQLLVLDWMHGGGGAHSWGYVVKKIHHQYDELRGTLSPDEFARLAPPREKLTEIRPEFVHNRYATGDPYIEWTLTLLETLSAAGCCVLLVCPNRRSPAGALQPTGLPISAAG